MSERKILRWGTAERLEHFVIMVLIPLFVISGLPLFNSEWFGWMLASPLDVNVFRDIHKICVGLYGALGLFHILYHTIALRRMPRIFVGRKEIREAIQTIKYYIGRADTLPKIGFHHPTELIMSYWLMAVWFMIFMGASGLVLLMPWYFPIWLHEWALVIHDIFFILITAILLMHFYMSILFKEHRELLDGMFGNGEVTTKYAKTHHPLWYDEITKKE